MKLTTGTSLNLIRVGIGVWVVTTMHLLEIRGRHDYCIVPPLV